MGKGVWLGEAVSLWGRRAGPSHVASVPPPPPQPSPVESDEEEPEEQDWEEDSGEGPPVFQGLVGTGGGLCPAVPGRQVMSFLPSPPQSARSPSPKRQGLMAAWA